MFYPKRRGQFGLGTSAFALLCITACSPDCVNTVKQETKSPDGKYVATAFVRNCGATTDFSAQVDVHDTGSKLGSEGNVYRGYRSQDITLAWASPTHLVITSGCLQVKYLVTNLHGITIERFAAKQ
jgi:Family of unknown function (DUF5412)